MEEEIEDYLQEIYKNRLKLEVKFVEFRHYKVILTFKEATAEISFTYDNNFVFDVNMMYLEKFIDCCILNYYKGVKV